MEKLDQPVDVFGEMVSERIATVSWEGGKIAPASSTSSGSARRSPPRRRARLPSNADLLERRGRPLDRRTRLRHPGAAGHADGEGRRRQRHPLRRRRLPPRRPRTTTRTDSRSPSGSPASSPGSPRSGSRSSEGRSAREPPPSSRRSARCSRRLPRRCGARRRGGARLHLDREDGHTEARRPHRAGRARRRPAPRPERQRPGGRDHGLRGRALPPLPGGWRRPSQRELTCDVPERGPIRRRGRTRLGVEDRPRHAGNRSPAGKPTTGTTTGSTG